MWLWGEMEIVVDMVMCPQMSAVTPLLRFHLLEHSLHPVTHQRAERPSHLKPAEDHLVAHPRARALPVSSSARMAFHDFPCAQRCLFSFLWQRTILKKNLTLQTPSQYLLSEKPVCDNARVSELRLPYQNKKYQRGKVVKSSAFSFSVLPGIEWMCEMKPSCG